jgi:hypothetical protein
MADQMNPLRNTVNHDEPTWLEKVWMDVQAEIDFETAHPQTMYCACANPLNSEQEQRDGICRECL